MVDSRRASALARAPKIKALEKKIGRQKISNHIAGPRPKTMPVA